MGTSFPLGPVAIMLLVFVGSYPLPAAVAQRQPGSVGVGLQAGRPGGATAKIYRPRAIAYDVVLTTDADDLLTGYVHRLWERPVPDSPLYLYVGPGLLVGTEGLSQTPRLRLGLSAEAGLNFYAERFEVFLHVTPALHFFPKRRAELDGSVGLRYYLRFP